MDIGRVATALGRLGLDSAKTKGGKSSGKSAKKFASLHLKMIQRYFQLLLLGSELIVRRRRLRRFLAVLRPQSINNSGLLRLGMFICRLCAGAKFRSVIRSQCV